MSQTRTCSKACLALMVIAVLFESTEARQLPKGMPMFTRKRHFECFERVKIIEGGTAELRCDADGNPKPNIAWTRFEEVVCNKNNVNVTGWSILLKNITKQECGLYKCKVCNEHGCRTFEYLVEMDEHAKDVVTVGSRHVLVSYISGKLTKWFKNTHNRNCIANVRDKMKSKMPDPDNNNNLTFERIAYTDAGLYICTAGLEYYLKELIVLNNKFENESHHEHYFVMKNSGSMITLECAWNGANTTWTKNNKPFVNNTNSAIVINNLTRDDGGLYRCEVCYRSECKAHQFLLVVDTIFTEGSMLNLTKNANSTKRPYCRSVLPDFNVQFSISYVKGKIIDENDALLQGNLTIPVNKDTKPACEEIGWCTCIVTSGYGKHFKSAYLQLAQPSAAQFKRNISTNRVLVRRVGKSLNISCEAEGNSRPNITWTQNGKNLDQTTGIPSGTHKMNIESLELNDSGEYSCRICNEFGCNERTYGILVRRQSDKNVKNITANVNSTTRLTCLDKYHSFVQNITWTKNGETFAPLHNTLQYVRRLNVLMFQNVQHSDAGTYMCKVLFHSGDTINITFHVVIGATLKKTEMHPGMYSTIMISVGISACLCATLLVLWMICTKLIKRIQANGLHGSNHYLGNSYETMDIIAMSTLKIEQKRHSILSRITSSDPDYEIPTDSRWEFPRAKLELRAILAQGTFGKVVQAEARGIVPGTIGTTTVAVKMLKLRHTDDDVEDFIRELDIMKMIGKHPNIVNLLGCCCTDGPMYIITEYAPHGNLKHFLREHHPEEIDASSETVKQSTSLSVNQLTDFAFQIAQGMQYLASRKCVHRDLAARNILVGVGYVMKICDFGLARNVQHEELYHKTTPGKLPIRWMAPESLEYRLFSTQSDVWAFGVLTWEIMSLGEQPYKDWDNIHDQLETGRRLERPGLCPDEIFQLMTGCWEFRAEMRPTFGEIAQRLEGMVVVAGDEEYAEVYTAAEDPPEEIS